MTRTPKEPTRPTFGSDEGFSLAELVIAVAIILVVCVGGLAAITFAAQAAQDSQMRELALSVATNQVEYARSLPLDSVGTVGGTPNGVLSSSWTTVTPVGSLVVTESITYQRDKFSNTNSVRYYTKTSSSLAKRMIVRVSWTNGFKGNVVIDTLLTGHSDDTNLK